MSRTATTSFTVLSVPANGAGNFNQVIGDNNLNIFRVKVTPSLAGGTYQAQLYEKDTFLAADLLWGTNAVSKAVFQDPVDKDASGTEVNASRRFIAPYEDKDASGEVHFRIVNNDSQIKNFDVEVEYEEVPIFGTGDDMEIDGNYKFKSGTAFFGTLDHAITVARTWTFPDITDTLVALTATQTLTNKTLTLPTIGDFTNATHSHQTAAGGGTLDAAAIAAGTLAMARGGTAASLTAVNGGIFYSTASAGAISAAGSSGQILRSAGAAAPTWSTATYPATVGALNTILRSDGTNYVNSTTVLENATGNIVTLDGTGTLSGVRTVSGLWTFSGNIIMTAGTDIRPSADSTTAINIANAAGTDFVTFDTTNSRVGIGTTGPTALLDVNKTQTTFSTAFTSPHLKIGGEGVNNTGYSGIAYAVSNTDNFGWTTGALRGADVDVGAFVWKFHNNSAGGTELMRISSAGNVGINQTSPTAQLEVVSGAAGRQIQILRHAATPTVNAWEIQNSASAVQVAIGSTFGLVMGSPTGGDKGAGTINVATDIFKANTAYTNPDYVLEHWATGRIETFKSNTWASDYRGLLPLSDLEQFVKQNYHLPLISRQPSGMFDRGDMLLATVEESYLYLFDHEHQIKALHAKITSLESQIENLKARLN